MNNHLLRVSQAAETLNVSRWTIYRWIDEGRLQATKIGKGSVRIFSQSVETLVQNNRKESGWLVSTTTR